MAEEILEAMRGAKPNGGMARESVYICKKCNLSLDGYGSPTFRLYEHKHLNVFGQLTLLD